MTSLGGKQLKTDDAGVQMVVKVCVYLLNASILEQIYLQNVSGWPDVFGTRREGGGYTSKGTRMVLNTTKVPFPFLPVTVGRSASPQTMLPLSSD